MSWKFSGGRQARNKEENKINKTVQRTDDYQQYDAMNGFVTTKLLVQKSLKMMLRLKSYKVLKL
jgi:hypothetical protein